MTYLTRIWIWPAIAVGILAAGCVSAQDARATDDVNGNAALEELQGRIAAYVTLQGDLAAGLGPPRPGTSPASLTGHKELLAAAIARHRKNARQGDLISPAAAAIIRREVALDLETRPPDDRRSLLEEIPLAEPVLNAAYPEEEALATVPPLLLQRLPPLPETLQYRFLGRHIVLLDADASVVIDYVPNIFSGGGS
jgi:hypothetical protein